MLNIILDNYLILLVKWFNMILIKNNLNMGRQIEKSSIYKSIESDINVEKKLYN